jgi:hypothetical protein
VIKRLDLDGPILLPLVEDLPPLARPLSPSEIERSRELAKEWGVASLERSLPVSIVGTGPDLNSATDNGLQRAAELFHMTVPEVKNRATITGGIEIGRHPGVVQVTLRVPRTSLAERGLLSLVEKHYEGFES